MLRDPAPVTDVLVSLARRDDQGSSSAVSGEVRVSAGTAAVLGLQPLKQEYLPTTAYLMVGERCRCNCSFCAQARSSSAQSGFLSRVVWPSFAWADTLKAISTGYGQGLVKRCCLQVTVSDGYLQRAEELVRDLASIEGLPICTSIAAPSLDAIERLLNSGAERVTLALDAAGERVFHAVKGQGWARRLELLRQAAQEFRGRIGTHLIVGLGETEREMLERLQEMVERKVTVGLFAFTPVAGTAWAAHAPPPITVYRRIQAAWYLLRTQRIRLEDMVFGADQTVTSFGLGRAEIAPLLADGVAFQTAGCTDCNRPYYNERPGKAMYNYPRPLRAEEIRQALDEALAVQGEAG
ncbi:MAG TPA: radical SAM protein [Anaerolineae bacterium]|nr:radical SAM protein [Anaerolineae bacterium]HQJ50252.1 radical SAM protein [Anaerolineae bacterium]